MKTAILQGYLVKLEEVGISELVTNSSRFVNQQITRKTATQHHGLNRAYGLSVNTERDTGGIEGKYRFQRANFDTRSMPGVMLLLLANPSTSASRSCFENSMKFYRNYTSASTYIGPVETSLINVMRVISFLVGSSIGK